MNWGHDKPKCERCERFPRVDGERYCRSCRNAIIAKMRKDKYLDDDHKEPAKEKS